MHRGPDLILACPHCGALARLFTLLEGSPAGAISWTDGYQLLPDAPRQPSIARCRSCHRVHWMHQAAEVGMIDPPEMVAEGAVPRFTDFSKQEPPAPGTPPPEGWVETTNALPLDEAGFFEALREGLAYEPEQELELRVNAWWRGNDTFRDGKAAVRYATSPEAVENMDRLVELTKDGDHELVLFRAEALRQLGRFTEAREALYGLCSDYALARETLIDLISEKSRNLEVLFIPTAEPQTATPESVDEAPVS